MGLVDWMRYDTRRVIGTLQRSVSGVGGFYKVFMSAID